MTQLALKMYDYHVWANQTLFKRLRELSDDVYNKEIKSVFPSISKVVSHMYIVDQLWFHIISGKNMTEALKVEKETGEGKGIEEMDKLFYDLSQKYKEFLNQQEDFEKLVELDIPWEVKRETSLSEMVLHIVTHATYHRGNITSMLRQMGYASVTTDYTRYWYAGK
ncbi:DinB family protein [Bacillus sp. EAC]|uniref:DinB family protein n=1 Tax=Bacillus sp. EAC TaxID=1978338 RepID=UPI000B44B44B|nr:DinB family protein [Bacillus sp. EAC]